MTQSAMATQLKKASCEECGAEHLKAECPILRQQNNTIGETYNLSWKKHPNFSWSNQNRNRPQGQYQQREKKPQLEEMFGKFMEKTNQYMMAVALTGRAPGSLPSNTKINSKEHAKAITTRSGKQLLEIHVKRPGVNQETKSPAIEETIEHDERMKESTLTEDSSKSQRLKKQKLEQQYKKFLEVFKKLHINILLVDALFQMSNYAKFLKDILSNKLPKFRKKLSPKLKDPRSFTVPWTIGEIYFDKALCDRGSSINLMPISVFKKLGLEEAKATTVTLQLADQSLTHPSSIIEDMLVKVEKFIFPIGFLILDMEEDKDVPLILDRPFLAIGRALIDV
ncbi:uncharacterized protein LOC111368998 [Olea europaea var. sylvestris]|uniref:uncharacterized protein LOC111368998 n=1 Tax=Olea europaea var. sylvestris TaxID=158386 RepID=UPI000C1D54FF|nr:uncharacterized protein LOC111368998 [Olea europaea var. sylvestris]